MIWFEMAASVTINTAGNCPEVSLKYPVFSPNVVNWSRAVVTGSAAFLPIAANLLSSVPPPQRKRELIYV